MSDDKKEFNGKVLNNIVGSAFGFIALIIFLYLVYDWASLGTPQTATVPTTTNNTVTVKATTDNTAALKAKADAEAKAAEEAKKKEIKVYKLNEVAAAGKLEVTATKSSTVTSFKTQYNDVQKTDNQFVIVTVKLTNKDEHARDVSSKMFKLVDSDGKTYDPYDKTVIDDSLLIYETINPGISRTKKVLFETPKDITIAKLRADSGVAFAGGQPVDIGLQ